MMIFHPNTICTGFALVTLFLVKFDCIKVEDNYHVLVFSDYKFSTDNHTAASFNSSSKQFWQKSGINISFSPRASLDDKYLRSKIGAFLRIESLYQDINEKNARLPRLLHLLSSSDIVAITADTDSIDSEVMAIRDLEFIDRLVQLLAIGEQPYIEHSSISSYSSSFFASYNKELKFDESSSSSDFESELLKVVQSIVDSDSYRAHLRRRAVNPPICQSSSTSADFGDRDHGDHDDEILAAAATSLSSVNDEVERSSSPWHTSPRPTVSSPHVLARHCDWNIAPLLDDATAAFVRSLAKSAHAQFINGELSDICTSGDNTDAAHNTDDSDVSSNSTGSIVESSANQYNHNRVGKEVAEECVLPPGDELEVSHLRVHGIVRTSADNNSSKLTASAAAAITSTTAATSVTTGGGAYDGDEEEASTEHSPPFYSLGSPSSSSASASAVVRIMCLTYTISPYHEAIREIRSTWGKRCDGYLAFSNSSSTDISILHITPGRAGWKEDYNEMWAKSQAIWRLMATTFLSSGSSCSAGSAGGGGSCGSDYYDYFVIGGDDLYILVDNLRQYLGSQEILSLSEYGTKPIYLGRPLRANSYQVFNSGGSGYILNAPAVALFNTMVDRDECLPTIATSMEDLMVAQCLRLAGVRTVDTKHPLDGRHIFHPLSPRGAYWANASWYTRMGVDFQQGEGCCSPYSISFQDIRGVPQYMTCLHRHIYCSTSRPPN